MDILGDFKKKVVTQIVRNQYESNLDNFGMEKKNSNIGQ